MVSRRPNKQIKYFWEISCQLPNIFFTIVEKLFHYGVIVKSDCDSHGLWWAVDVTCGWHLCWKVINAVGNRVGKRKEGHSSLCRETLNFKRWTDCNTGHISFQRVHFSMQFFLLKFFPKWKSGRNTGSNSLLLTNPISSLLPPICSPRQFEANLRNHTLLPIAVHYFLM